MNNSLEKLRHCQNSFTKLHEHLSRTPQQHYNNLTLAELSPENQNFAAPFTIKHEEITATKTIREIPRRNLELENTIK